MHAVKKVEYLKDYKLCITFEDRSCKEVDLQNYLDGEVFQPLKNPDYFKTAKVHPELETIYWENGADLAPEFLYEIGKNFDEGKKLREGGVR